MNEASTSVGTCPYCGTPLHGSSPTGACVICNLEEVQPSPLPPIVRPLPPPTLEEIRGALPQFESFELAGSGAHGAVFKATERAYPRVVAVKAVRLRSIHDQPGVRFALECQALAQLRSPYVPAFHYKATCDHIHYIVMDWMPEGTLEQLITAGTMRLSVIIHLMDQLCLALSFVHKQGWIHRDVKPGNILIDRCSLRLSDFGVVKHMAPGPGLTETGVCLGTIGYMAPEQTEGRAVDARADIYSVAAVFYHLLTGEEPKGSFMPDPSELGVPSIFDAIIKKATKVDPDQRHSSMEVFREALNHAWKWHRVRVWAAALVGCPASGRILWDAFRSL